MKEFRDRVLIPTLIPLGAMALIAVIVLNVSQLLIALEEESGPETVTALAVILSSGILFGFTWFSSRGDEQRSSSSVALLSLAGLMVLAAGFFGAEFIHENEEEERAHAAAEAEASAPDLIVHAIDINWREKELRIGPGTVGIQMVNEGAIAHTFVLEGVTSGRKLSTPAAGDTDTAKFELQPGNYVYFCDVPGHRQGGMEGTLIVDPAAPAPGSGGGGGGGAAAGTPIVIEGLDIRFEPREVTAPAGPVAITLKNVGAIQHNLLIQEDPSFNKLDVAPGQSATGTLQAKPGTYTLYCDIAGHRPAGMETKLTVT
ncbi:MAG TPA: plastocyanin/azurin family copper-binding protein [Acidimicrobiia bacterium]|nr:plastocyanin/azurin family copper-binding protein [Acidimicrobiia bacterium]